MSVPTRSVARGLAVLAVLVLLLSACGGGEEVVETLETTTSPSQTPTTEVATTTTDGAVEPIPLLLTFDGGSCIHQGATELTPGPINLTFLNESEGSAAINMIILEEGYTIQDVIDYNGPEPTTKHHPSWSQEIAGVWQVIASGESHQWEGDLEAGLYAGRWVRMSPLCAGFGFGVTVEG